MTRRPFLLVTSLLALLGPARHGRVPAPPLPRNPVGVGSGSGHALPPGRGFLTLGAALTAQARQLGPARVMAGLALTRHVQGPHGDVGSFQPDGKTIGGAWPFFRSLSAIGALDFPGTVGARLTAGVGA